MGVGGQNDGSHEREAVLALAGDEDPQMLGPHRVVAAIPILCLGGIQFRLVSFVARMLQAGF